MAASKIDTKKIRTDRGTQSRVQINEESVAEYAEAMERGEEFPPIKVYYIFEEDIFILVDGFHRLLAWIRVFPNDPILAEQALGTWEDALWESYSVNQSHGLRRTNADKRKAVEGALLHPTGLKMSNIKIAAHVGVSDHFVGNIKNELKLTPNGSEPDYRLGLDGRTINTANIGAKPRDAEPATPWKDDLNADSHENYEARLVKCCTRKKNEFRRNHPARDLRCGKCYHHEELDGVMICGIDEEPKTHDDLICDHYEWFERYVPTERPPAEILPLANDGSALLEDKSGKTHRTYATYADRGSIAVKLPPANPTRFVHELMSRFSKEYLATVLPVLHQKLMENDDDD